jgi:hypothetical protein
MYLLFSSDVRPRYKCDILDALCYPNGHIERFRYQEHHLAPAIREWKISSSGRVTFYGFKPRVLIIFCDTSNAETAHAFNFYPIRQARIVAMWKRGTVYYIDVQLAGFVNYHWGSPPSVASAFNEYQRLIAGIDGSPFPRLLPDGRKLSKGQAWSKEGKVTGFVPGDDNQSAGFLFLKSTDVLHTLVASRPGADDDRAWESTVDSLCSNSSLSNSLFFRIDGLFAISRSRLLPLRFVERLIRPLTIATESHYRLPMGKHVLLKLLFYRPDAPPYLGTVDLKIEAMGDGFAGVLPSDVKVDSRYNEQRIVIACKRVLDNVIAPILIKLRNSPVNPHPEASATDLSNSAHHQLAHSNAFMMSEPFLLAQISVSRIAIFWIILGLVVGALLLSIGPDYARAIGDWQWLRSLSPSIADFMKNHPADAASLSKIAAAIITLIAGFFGLRKLPLGK